MTTHKSEHAPGVNLPEDEALINEFRIRLLANCKGREKAVVAPKIIDRLRRCGFTVNEPKLRAVVNYLNGEGFWAASCHKGYFFAVTSEEKTDYLAQLNSRIAGIQNRINGLERT